VKLTKSKLQSLIREAVLEESGNNINFEWGSSGMTMRMFVNGNEVLSFDSQQEVINLIEQLQGLLQGPMRTSP